MAMDKIMPDDMNEVACAMLAYINEEDRQAGAKMSYGDFGKFLAEDYGKNPHGVSGPDECSIEATRKSIRITTLSGNEYELTWNKVAKFIHPYLKSATVSETVETDTPTDLQNMTAAVTNTTIDIPTFDYSTVDDDTADFLRKATDKIVTNLSLILSSQADIGAILIEARDRLSNHYHGGFEKWYRSLGMSKSSVNRLIQVREFRENLLKSSQLGQLTDDPIELFDSLPKMLQSDISSPSAPAEAVNAVLSGDITTHRDFIAMKKELEESQAKIKMLEKEIKNNEEYEEAIEYNNEKLESRVADLEIELKEARSQPQDAVIIPDPKESQEYKELLGKATNFKNLMLESKRKSNDLEKELSGLKKELEEERDSLGKGSVKLFTIKMTMTEFSKLLDITKGTEVADIVRNARPMSI